MKIIGKGERIVEYEEDMTVEEVLESADFSGKANILKSDGSVALEDLELEEGEKLFVMGKDAPWGSRIFLNEKEGKLIVTPVVSGG